MLRLLQCPVFSWDDRHWVVWILGVCWWKSEIHAVDAYDIVDDDDIGDDDDICTF